MSPDKDGSDNSLQEGQDSSALTPRGDITTRSSSHIARHGYSATELNALYSLSRVFLESGEIATAERVARGIISVEPDFIDAWLTLAYVALMREELDEAIHSAKKALALRDSSLEGLLLLVIAHFQLNDFQAGGTYLGEVSDRLAVERARPELRRLYDAQVIRFEERLRAGAS